MKNLYEVGTLVTLKTHPLLKEWRISGDGKYVPPIMIVIEVFVENKKKQLFNEETGQLIAELIKYTAVYFDDNRSEFVEATIYESMLSSYKNLKIERISHLGDIYDDSVSLIKEIESYTIPAYVYSGTLRFKTKKIEIYKKRTSKKIPLTEGLVDKKNIKEVVQYIVNYSTPDFIICGIKINEVKDLYYPNGDLKRKASKNLFKVKWFNPVQNKFSEQYLPENCFTDKMILSKMEEESFKEELG